MDRMDVIRLFVGMCARWYNRQSLRVRQTPAPLAHFVPHDGMGSDLGHLAYVETHAAYRFPMDLSRRALLLHRRVLLQQRRSPCVLSRYLARLYYAGLAQPHNSYLVYT